MSSKAVRFSLLAQILGLITALFAIEWVRTHLLFDFDTAAMGEYTSSLFGKSSGGATIHCTGVETNSCIDSWRFAGARSAILWFGNSQLHGVNRYGPGDKTAVMDLHDALGRKGQYVMSYSMPNISLAEVAVVWHALLPKLKVGTVIIPVVFNGLRDAGLRAKLQPLLADPSVKTRLESAAVAPDLRAVLSQADTVAKVDRSTATLVEDRLEAELSGLWPLWRDRNAVRTLLSYVFYKAWHSLAGATAQSKRNLLGRAYEAQLVLLKHLLDDFSTSGARVLLYVPPYRQDIPGPYIEAQYRKFKADIAAIAREEGAYFADIDDIVAGAEWGMVRDELFGTADYDFMHFTAKGHKKLAEALERQLEVMDAQRHVKTN